MPGQNSQTMSKLDRYELGLLQAHEAGKLIASRPVLTRQNFGARVESAAEYWPERMLPMSRITACTFVLAVPDLDSSRRYYIDKLGFTEDFSVDGWSFVSRGECQIRLGHCPDEVPVSTTGDHAWFAYLHVSDAQALHQEFSAAGVSFWHPLEDKPWGFREFAVQTPDGHRIVFGQELEGGA